MIDLLKLLAVLAGILFLLWRKWNLGVVLVLASLVIGLLFGEPLLGLLRDGWLTISDSTTIRLVAIVTLILALGALLKATAQLDGLVRSLGELFPDARLTLAVLPMLIGMLPMVGGAMFSAPMVGEVGDRLSLDGERRTFVNYWFRHVWEWVLPVYPSFVLAAALVGLSPRTLAVAQWPLTAVAIVAGVLVGLVPIKGRAAPSTNPKGRNGSLLLLAQSIWPILLVIVLSVALHVDLILSLVVTITLLVLIAQLSVRRVWQILRQEVSLKLVLLILSVMLFRQVMESTGAVDSIPNALTNAGVPVPLILFSIPLLAGLLTGLAAGAFGISFPVILPLLTAGGMNLGAVALAYAGGFIGVLLSPLHLCYSLTREYFKAEWGGSYRLLIPATLTLVLTAVGIYLIHLG